MLICSSPFTLHLFCFQSFCLCSDQLININKCQRKVLSSALIAGGWILHTEIMRVRLVSWNNVLCYVHMWKQYKVFLFLSTSDVFLHVCKCDSLHVKGLCGCVSLPLFQVVCVCIYRCLCLSLNFLFSLLYCLVKFCSSPFTLQIAASPSSPNYFCQASGTKT